MPHQSLQDVVDASRVRGPENSVGFWMWRLSLLYQRRVEETLSSLDLTHLQFLILVLTGWLESSAPPVRQSDVVAVSGVQAAQVSLMVKSLKAKRLVTQSPSAEDTRVRHLALTAAGISLLARATPVMGALQERLWPPGAETDTLLSILKATAHRLEFGDSDRSDSTPKVQKTTVL
jgi:DNA-binding MarR family transcriptional regulator